MTNNVIPFKPEVAPFVMECQRCGSLAFNLCENGRIECEQCDGTVRGLLWVVIDPEMDTDGAA